MREIGARQHKWQEAWWWTKQRRRDSANTERDLWISEGRAPNLHEDEQVLGKPEERMPCSLKP